MFIPFCATCLVINFRFVPPFTLSSILSNVPFVCFLLLSLLYLYPFASHFFSARTLLAPIVKMWLVLTVYRRASWDQQKRYSSPCYWIDSGGKSHNATGGRDPPGEHPARIMRHTLKTYKESTVEHCRLGAVEPVWPLSVLWPCGKWVPLIHPFLGIASLLTDLTRFLRSIFKAQYLCSACWNVLNCVLPHSAFRRA